VRGGGLRGKSFSSE